MNSDPVNETEDTAAALNTEEINDKVGLRDDNQSDTTAAAADLSNDSGEEENIDLIDYIKRMLESKSTAKQTTFKHLSDAFNLMSSDSKRIISELKSKAHPADEDVTLYFRNVSKHEFHVKLAGDLLIFVMHTNIITFDDEHPVMKEEYIHRDQVNRYFGQINIYNFMFDSLRFNRGNDPGYLIGRLMLNHENRFFMEGEKPFTSRFGNISAKEIDNDVLQDIVKHSLRIAIKNDLMAPPYSRVRSITLNQKNEHTVEMGGGQKIGFQMSYQKKVES
jgi:hypothetical protein